MIESGAIIHAFVGEERPPASSIMNLVKKTFKNTQAAQVTISPEFTICNDCKKVTQKLTDICGHCGSKNVYGVSRIVGYFSRINNWNKSKIGELADRHKGNYSVNDFLPNEMPVSAESCVTKCYSHKNFQPFVIVHKTGIKENNWKVRVWELGSTTSQPPILLGFFATLVRLGEAERTQQKEMKKWVRRA